MGIKISPEMRKSVDEIKAEFAKGVRVVTRDRQTGKTLALMEYIHEQTGGDAILVVCNFREKERVIDAYQAMFPDDKQPKVIALGHVQSGNVLGRDQPFATDEVWPKDVVKKAGAYEYQRFLAGVGTPKCMDMHSI